MVRLGDMASVLSGSTPSTSVDKYWNGEYMWVTPAELCDENVYIFETARKITDEAIKNTNLKLLPVGTVLLSSRAPIGKVAITGVEMYCNQGFKNLICSHKLYNKYLFYFLKKNLPYLQSLGRGATFKEISKPIVESIFVPLPPLETQKKIADILDKAKSLIDLRKKQIEKMDLLIKSKFIEMFGDPVTNPKGWKVKPLKSICFKLTDGTHFSPESYSKGDYKYITAKNIKRYGFDLESITYVPKDIHNMIYKRCNPEYGDILYIKDGVTTGVALINTLTEEFSMLSSVALLKHNRNLIVNYYLRDLLNNNQMYKTIRGKMGGAAITRLTITKLNGLAIPVPPLHIQQQYSFAVESVEKQKYLLQQALEKMEINYKSLMQEYFG